MCASRVSHLQRVGLNILTTRGTAVAYCGSKLRLHRRAVAGSTKNGYRGAAEVKVRELQRCITTVRVAQRLSNLWCRLITLV